MPASPGIRKRSGNTVLRCFSPVRSRTVISLRVKSTSLTRAAQAKAFHEPQTAAVVQACHQRLATRQRTQHCQGLGTGHHNWHPQCALGS